LPETHTNITQLTLPETHTNMTPLPTLMRRAPRKILLRLCVDEADVVVKVVSVGMAQALDILFDRDRVAQVVVHRTPCSHRRHTRVATWRAHRRAAKVALLLPSLSFPAFAQLSNKRLSLSLSLSASPQFTRVSAPPTTAASFRPGIKRIAGSNKGLVWSN